MWVWARIQLKFSSNWVTMNGQQKVVMMTWAWMKTTAMTLPAQINGSIWYLGCLPNNISLGSCGLRWFFVFAMWLEMVLTQSNLDGIYYYVLPTCLILVLWCWSDVLKPLLTRKASNSLLTKHVPPVLGIPNGANNVRNSSITVDVGVRKASIHLEQVSIKIRIMLPCTGPALSNWSLATPGMEQRSRRSRLV